MENEEAVKRIRAYIECKKMQSKGNIEECSMYKCFHCKLREELGSEAEHIESIEIALKALEETIKRQLINTYGSIQNIQLYFRKIVQNVNRLYTSVSI